MNRSSQVFESELACSQKIFFSTNIKVVGTMAPVFWQSGRQGLKNNMTDIAVSFIFYIIIVCEL